MHWRIAFVFAMILMVGACSPPQEPVRIGILLWPPYDLAVVARAEGFIDPEQVQLIDYQTPAEVVRASRNGLLDGFFLTTQYALQDHPAGQDARIVYIIDHSEGGDSLLVRPGVDSLAQLKGKRIALEAGPLGAYMLQRVLDHAGLTRADIDLHFVDTPDHVHAYASGAVDAVITYEPFGSRVAEAGAHKLFSSRDIPNEIVDVLYVTEALIEERGQDLVSLVRGIEQARKLLESRPEHVLPIMAERHRMDTESFARALEGVSLLGLEENLELLSGEQPKLSVWIERQIEVFQRAGMWPPGQPSVATPDPRIVDRALQ
ncbi:MAG: ABC transporter substrate-binding protein [Wenzhouxiangellaceae bacterium]